MAVRDDWKSSPLWKELTARSGEEVDAVRAFLERSMPDIARVLAHGGSSPPDFTLHDAEHSFRVAAWMARLLPDGLLALLSEYEIALLLLSAYLHDIGMTPELGKVRRHRDVLLTGEASLLSDEDVRRFQYWLDAAGYGATLPLDPSRPLDETVRLADEIITGYTRHRHNDWSEEWIRARFAVEPLGGYAGWMADLVRLCRSHHEGYDALAGREFDPRRVGSGATVVHLRYLAALLRMGDVLDVDRERTPAVVFHHRDVSADSQPYWQKDAELTIHLENGQVSAYARPPRAYLHRAVEETLDGIDRELALCRRLADVTRFEKPVGPGADLPHRWILQATVFRDVEPREGAYQYIDGAFRPNTRRLLELLSGTALYGDPLAAVRELLQNGFDAVRELIAHRRLRMPDPSDRALEAQIGASLWVRLLLEQEGDRWWLICRDDGVGMTQEIIRDALLVSGSPPRPEVLELDRRCRAAGFRLGRTGQFGIGALSYFMLADRVVLTTRRANEAGWAEQNGWCFESSGVGSFGELRADRSLPHGSEVRMRLRPGAVADPTEFSARLSEYLRATLVHIPCNLHFGAPTEAASFRRPAGWTMEEAERVEAALRQFRPSGEETGFTDPESASPKLRRAHVRHERRWRAIRREAAEKLRWATHEGDLPEGMGRYRLHLPYFQVADGVSLPFIRPRSEPGGLVLRPVAGGDYQLTAASTSWGWKGMQVDVTTPSRPPDPLELPFRGGLVPAESLFQGPKPARAVWEEYGVLAEVDFQSAAVGTLAVSRGWLELGPKGEMLLGWIGGRARKLVDKFLSGYSGSPFALLNARVLGVSPPQGAQYQWALSPASVMGEAGKLRAVRWGPLPFPLTLDYVFRSSPSLRLLWEGQPLSKALAMRRYGAEWNGQALTWAAWDAPPDRMVAITGGAGISLVPVWTAKPGAVQTPFTFGWIAEFPPEWQHLSAAAVGGTDDVLVWNRRDPVVRAAVGAAEELLRSIHLFSLPFSVRSEALATPGAAAAWVLNKVASISLSVHIGAGSSAWDDVRSTAPDFLPRIWTLLFGVSAHADGAWQPVTFLRDRWGSREIVTLTPAGVRTGGAVPLPAASEWVAYPVTP